MKHPIFTHEYLLSGTERLMNDVLSAKMKLKLREHYNNQRRKVCRHGFVK